MRSYLSGLAAALALGAAGAVHAQTPRTHLVMTCHELLQGVPQKEPTIYEVVGPSLFRSDDTGQQLIISMEGSRKYLSTTRDGRKVEQSYASHVVSGPILTRTVFRRPEGGGPMRVSFTERYDFARQRYTSSFDRRDACHHDGRP